MRTVREQVDVQDAVNKAEERWPGGAQEAWDAAVWAVARDATIGRALSTSGKVRQLILEGARSIGLPTLNIIYEIDNGTITVHEAIFSEPKAPQAGHA